MPKLPSPILVERFGLAFCFLSIGIWEAVRPSYWFGYVPSAAMTAGFDLSLMVRLHGVFLCLIGAAVLTGFRLRLASGLATLMLLGITVSLAVESGFSEIFLRDVAILALAVAVFLHASEGEKNPAR